MSQYGKKGELRARRAYREFEEGRKAFYLECGASEELCKKLMSGDEPAFRSFMRDLRRRADVNPDLIAAEPEQREYEGDEWLDDIDSQALFKAVSSLPEDEIELLGDYAIRGCTQREIARDRKMSQGCVSKKLSWIFSTIRIALACESENASPGADEEGSVEKCPSPEDESGEKRDEDDR